MCCVVGKIESAFNGELHHLGVRQARKAGTHQAREFASIRGFCGERLGRAAEVFKRGGHVRRR